MMLFFFLFYLINIIYVCISIIIFLNKKFILIDKLNKYNWVNIMYFKIKYLDPTYLLIFQVLFLDIVNDYLFIYLHT